jgi:hypothetical protein
MIALCPSHASKSSSCTFAFKLQLLVVAQSSIHLNFLINLSLVHLLELQTLLHASSLEKLKVLLDFFGALK